MNRRRLLQMLAACTALLAACGQPDAAAAGGSSRTADTATVPLDPERAVRRIVTLFGSRMQTVSLLAPDSIAASRLQEAYGTLVTPDLLSDWMARPTVAPGRRVSSPWPDRIEVKSITPSGADEYLVTGSLIFESSAGESAESMATRPVRLHVRRGGSGRWRISMYEQPATGGDAS